MAMKTFQCYDINHTYTKKQVNDEFYTKSQCRDWSYPGIQCYREFIIVNGESGSPTKNYELDPFSDSYCLTSSTTMSGTFKTYKGQSLVVVPNIINQTYETAIISVKIVQGTDTIFERNNIYCNQHGTCIIQLWNLESTNRPPVDRDWSGQICIHFLDNTTTESVIENFSAFMGSDNPKLIIKVEEYTDSNIYVYRYGNHFTK